MESFYEDLGRLNHTLLASGVIIDDVTEHIKRFKVKYIYRVWSSICGNAEMYLTTSINNIVYIGRTIFL